jgi:hypothetical protein
MVHGDEAEEVVVVFGDRFPGPVLVDRAYLELLEIPPELHEILLMGNAASACGDTPGC